MAFRKILCVLGGSPGDTAALATAFALARQRDGHVAVLVPQPDPRNAIPMVGEGVSGMMVSDIMKVMEQENSQRLTQARALFDAAVAQAGAVVAEHPSGPGGITASFHEADGIPEDAVVTAARVSDVTIFPSVSGDRDTAIVLALEACLMGSARPLVVAPPSGPEVVARRVAVAWNGSAEATRAVALALPVLCAADQVVVLTAETGKTAGSAARDLLDYLAWNGVRAQAQTVEVRGEAVGAALLRTALGAGADLLVMGGYGHSRLRELILGGVTRHVLGHAQIPVLMAH
ncbi:universal stress protein [Aerophototrophica crusticola]|uniref:Universal stress protein n=1 Tax=Aerophototrophica crusticola TaxID=1709002 RepID=A0A858R4L6_9PROT|nr:universal stress protein [Rhodospirillaceae bacterium B3]